MVLSNLGVGVVNSLTPCALDVLDCPEPRVEEPVLPLVCLVDCLLQSLCKWHQILTHLVHSDPHLDHVVRVLCIIRHQTLEPRLSVSQEVPQKLQLARYGNHIQMILHHLEVTILLCLLIEGHVSTVTEHGCERLFAWIVSQNQRIQER